MKIAVIGGGSVRTPKLLIGLLHEQELLNLSEVSLMDDDVERLELIGNLAEEMLSLSNKDCKFKITYCDDYISAVKGADFVISSIRVGKEDGRIKDERVPLKYGVIGQETTGPGGFAMALRNIPPIVKLARCIEVYAPNAWLISFTNPSGIITQAVASYCNVKVIGICDAPSQLQRNLKNVYNLPDDSTFIDYFGLNHLGWIKRVVVNQSDIMPKILANIERYVDSERCKFFTSDFIKGLGLIPNEYLYFYYYAYEAVERIRHSKITRGEMIKKINTELFSELRRSKGENALKVYYLYNKARHNSYMKIDTGEFDSNQSAEYVTLRKLANIDSTEEKNIIKSITSYDRKSGGYEVIALQVIKSLLDKKGNIITVLGKNEGSIPGLDAEDIVEVPAHISRAGRF
ncbi:MAG: hypothetical protein ABGF52_13560, partial [Candidatus Asgardarchaeum sp.]